MYKKFLLLIILFTDHFNSTAQWTTNGNLVCGAADEQEEPRLVTDARGGAFIAWVDFRNDPKKGDIYIQRINGKGQSLWALNGVAACNTPEDQGGVALSEDGQGGVFLAWNDWRSGSGDIYVQRIDSTGKALWTANGVPAASGGRFKRDARILSDGSGGAILVWQDSGKTDFDVYAQRLDATGAEMWTKGGVAVCNSSQNQINPRLETDGSGGAIFTWQDRRNGNDYDIYVQRITASGTVSWASNGVAIATVTGTQSNPKIEPDGSGGAYVSWQDKRGSNYDIYIQRVNASGSRQWTSNGVAVCSATNSQSGVDMTSKGGIDGVILVWKDDRNGLSDLYVQKVNPSGTYTWTANGVRIAGNSGPELKANITGDGLGGAIVVWQDSTAGNWDIVSSRIDGAGKIIWTNVICNATDDQTNAKNLSVTAGGDIIVYQDKRNQTDKNIYAMFIGSSLQSVYSMEYKPNIKISPNPGKSLVRITTNTIFHHAGLRVSNMQGQIVKEILIGTGNDFQIDTDDLKSGTYLLEIISPGEFKASSHMIILH